MDDQTFRFARILAWATPAAIAGVEWGMPVGLLTFGGQMFAATPLTRMWAMWKASRGDPLDADGARRAYIAINLVCGGVFAFLSRLVVGDHGAAL